MTEESLEQKIARLKEMRAFSFKHPHSDTVGKHSFWEAMLIIDAQAEALRQRDEEAEKWREAYRLSVLRRQKLGSDLDKVIAAKDEQLKVAREALDAASDLTLTAIDMGDYYHIHMKELDRVMKVVAEAAAALETKQAEG